MVGDTHGKPIELPGGDVLIHSGDLTHLGSFRELKEQVAWLKSQPHRFKIFVGGNHDVCLENLMHKSMEAELRRMLHPIVYLRDSGIIIKGIRFWGSPWIPPYSGGFQAEAEERKRRFGAIPAVDVLVTHGPAAGTLDGGAGCEYLRTAIARIHPRVHCHGHVHEHPGQVQSNSTVCFNVAKTPAAYLLA
jgi:Icc-related predicted phosphoesterase